MDVVLLVFDVVVAIGLWVKKPWAIVAVFLGIMLLQWIPYTVFRRHFIQSLADPGTLNGLIGTEVLLLAILGVLLFAKK